MNIHWRIAACVALLASGLAAAEEQQGASSHPLATHMNQWLAGSREWSTPNPDFDAEQANSFREYRVRWDWGPFKQQLNGKLFGVTADDKRALFWTLQATYNPVTEQVHYQQVGWAGDLITGLDPVRRVPLAFGEEESLSTMHYSANGSSKITQHRNVFRDNGTHSADVYEKGEDGSWELKQQWQWRLVAEEEVLGKDL